MSERIIVNKTELQQKLKKTLIEMGMYREETQKSICEWADTTFGETTPDAAIDRCVKEMEEFDKADAEHVANEAADVVITLYRVAQVMGFDLLEAVDLKMRVNRGRTWTKNGDGTGQHT